MADSKKGKAKAQTFELKGLIANQRKIRENNRKKEAEIELKVFLARYPEAVPMLKAMFGHSKKPLSKTE